jgi:hypothetical protein
MTQVHLAKQFPHYLQPCNPPSTRAMTSPFVAWPFNIPHTLINALYLPETLPHSLPFNIITLVSYSNASFLTQYFFAACFGC